MINPLLLHTNADIPFVMGLCSVHNPTIKEISLIGEETFQVGSRFLNFDKSDFEFEDNSDLSDKEDFEILIEIMNSKEYYKFTQKAVMVLTLLFPSYDITIEKDKIKLSSKDSSKETRIDKRNYDEFRDIVKTIFVLEAEEEKKYNPADGMAQKIAEKFKKANKKLAKLKGGGDKDKALFGRMISVLAVGLGKDKNILCEYTVYQLLDEYKRFQLKLAYDINLKARLAGATDLDDPEDWLDNLLL